jgi:putative endonuclease
MWYVYILKCANGKNYYGSTSDINERLSRHKNGYVPATSGILPVELKIYIAFADKYRAFEFKKN